MSALRLLRSSLLLCASMALGAGLARPDGDGPPPPPGAAPDAAVAAFDGPDDPRTRRRPTRTPTLARLPATTAAATTALASPLLHLRPRRSARRTR